jgi:hypothetical protein
MYKPKKFTTGERKMKNFLRAITLAICSYLTLHLYGCKTTQVKNQESIDQFLIENHYGRFEK